MNEPPQFVIAYWLLPAVPAQDFFRHTMRTLAAKYGAPEFEPHLTLAVKPDSPGEAELKLADLPTGAVELRIIGVAFTSAFTKTLFVRFGSSPFLLKFRTSLGADHEQEFAPHLSLLYQQLSEEEQARLAAEIQLPFAKVTFDAAAATRCRLPVETPAAVTLWETIASRRLIREEAG